MKITTRIALFGFLTIVVLAMALGALLTDKVRGGGEAASVRVVEEPKGTSWTDSLGELLSFAWFLFRVTLMALIIVALAVGLWVTYLFVERKASTVYPNQKGVYPVLKLRVGRAAVLHDPNRATTATTVYTTPELAENVQVVPVLAPGTEAEQAVVTGRAQAVQALAAISGGPQDVRRRREDVGQILGLETGDGNLAAKPLPPVTRSGLRSSHVERLLLENGALEDSDLIGGEVLR